MNLQRRIALAISLLAVGLGMGHFVQSRAAERAETAPRPEKIEQLSAGADAVTLKIEPPSPDGTVLASAEALAEEKSCPLQLDLLAKSQAMISLSLSAPCHGDQRVVIKHGGLAVTGHTTPEGKLMLDLPAMEEQARVTVNFIDGSDVLGRVEVPEVKDLHRFAVQWMDNDRFDLQAYEDGADFGTPGNINITNTGIPADGAQPRGGFLTVLGDTSVSLPMQAQVYTFPREGEAEVTVEATVTPSTCGREMLGEAVSSVGGKVSVSDVTLAMPDCSVPGGVLVLKNIVPDMEVAVR
jgi:hypothetical protein